MSIAPMPVGAAFAASKYAIEGFSESLADEMGMFGVRVKFVQPGLAPSTSFAANSGGRCDNQIPAAYVDYAGRYLKSMQEYPTAYTSAESCEPRVAWVTVLLLRQGGHTEERLWLHIQRAAAPILFPSDW